MLTSIVIFVLSLLLFIYWFRYTCVLVLRNAAEAKTAPRTAGGNQLQFPEVRERLNSTPSLELDPLHRALDRDYRVLTYLIDHAASLGPQSFERRILDLDYRLMQVWYRVTKSAAPRQARSALREMASIVEYLAEGMDEPGIRTHA